MKHCRIRTAIWGQNDKNLGGASMHTTGAVDNRILLSPPPKLKNVHSPTGRLPTSGIRRCVFHSLTVTGR